MEQGTGSRSVGARARMGGLVSLCLAATAAAGAALGASESGHGRKSASARVPCRVLPIRHRM